MDGSGFLVEDRLRADLKAMRALLSDPKRWTQTVYARDGNGMSCNAGYSGATQWCLVGAAHKVAGDVARVSAIRIHLKSLLGSPVAPWNDGPSRTHADVLALLDEAVL